MVRSAIRVFLVVIIAFAIAMPAGAGVKPMAGMAMPRSAGMMGHATSEPCQNCPQPNQPGGMSPDKMPGCPVLACVVCPALLPSPTVLPGSAVFRTEYAGPVTVLFAGTDPAPDPFPPRPIVLL